MVGSFCVKLVLMLMADLCLAPFLVHSTCWYVGLFFYEKVFEIAS